MGALTVRKLTKGYGATPVIEDFSLSVPAGKAVALVGPNGAGKSTLLQTIAGQLAAEGGQVKAGGITEIEDPLQFRRNLAYVPDNPVLFDDLTIAEHLAFYAAAFDVSDGDVRADDLLVRFRLGDRRDDLPTTFSRGMRQRAQLCCAFVRPAEVMLIDEPFVGLDPMGMRTLIELCLERKADGCALLVATHVMAAVERFCDELVVLAEGDILARGAPRKLLDDYGAATVDDLFVALVDEAAFDDGGDDAG